MDASYAVWLHFGQKINKKMHLIKIETFLKIYCAGCNLYETGASKEAKDQTNQFKKYSYVRLYYNSRRYGNYLR